MKCIRQLFRKTILLIILFIITNIVYSQPFLFEKVYDWSNDQILYDFIMTEGHSYVLGHSTNDILNITKFDSYGDSLWTYIVGQRGNFTGMQIIQSSNSDLLIATGCDSIALFLRLSCDGDSLSGFKQIRLNYENSYSKIAELPNGDYILNESVVFDPDFPPTNYLRRQNIFGDTIWQKSFDEDIVSVFVSLENEIIIFATDFSWDINAYLKKLDSLGNLIFNNLVYEESAAIHLVESKSSNYYAAVKGNCYKFNNDPFYAIKCDQNANIEWTLFNQFEYIGFPESLSQLRENLFSIYGEIGNKLSIKTFNDTGDSISTFEYDTYNYQSAKRICSDYENITVAGCVRDSIWNKSILLFKLPIDSLITSTINRHKIKVDIGSSFYPNPANDMIFFSNNIEKQKKKVTIYNQLGNMLFIKTNVTQRLDISSLKSGMYIIQIKLNGLTKRENLVIK